MYIFISMFLICRKFLSFSHWLIPKSYDGPHEKVVRVTCDPRAAVCLPQFQTIRIELNVMWLGTLVGIRHVAIS
jgi:hypothetical protein